MEKIDKCIVCGNQKSENFLEVKDYFLSNEVFTIVNCPVCGLKFVNPRPEEEKLGAYYKSDDYISHSNSRKGLMNKVYHLVRKINHKNKFKWIKKYFEKGSLLDIGCATGEFLNYMKQRNWTVSGIEPNKEARNFAKKNYGINVYDEEKLVTLDEGAFDVVTMWHVLEHVWNPDLRIKQVYKVLKNNGIVVIAIPNYESYDAGLYKEYWGGWDVPRHLFHFSQNSLGLLLSNNNFLLQEIKPMKFDSYYVSMLSEKYKYGKKNLFRSIICGYKSNVEAKKNNSNFSSLVYIFKKK